MWRNNSNFSACPIPVVACASRMPGGCLRSRDERFQWGGMNDSQKREVLRLCHQRYRRLRRAAAGRPSLF